jgi:germination protein M
MMYGIISRLMLLSLIAALVVALNACDKREEQPLAKPTRISATKAYEKYFGPAPTTDKGTCFAFVIYFPSAKKLGKVIPFPFFTFDEVTIKKVAVERLLSGIEVPAYKDEILQSFAPDVHLLNLAEHEGMMTVDLSKDFLRGGNSREGMLNALVLTLAQFEGVKSVKLLSEGKDVDFAKGTLMPVASAVLEPSPPRLLSVMAVKDRGAKEVEEVSSYFDRPVGIKELTLSDRSGKPFPGDLFQSVFDMAAVLKPKDPAEFKAGMRVKIRWKVVDKLARAAEGEGEFPLEVKEH